MSRAERSLFDSKTSGDNRDKNDIVYAQYNLKGCKGNERDDILNR